jgi:K+-sensing histidine kinase KdpD
MQQDGTEHQMDIRDHKVIAASNRKPLQVGGYVTSVIAVATMSGFIAVVPGADHMANVSLLYLLVVMGAAHWFGRGSAVLTSLLAVLSFDWFFVEPRHTFTVTNPAEWLALGVFLVTAMVMSQLTTLMRQRVVVEAQAQALAEADRLRVYPKSLECDLLQESPT